LPRSRRRRLNDCMVRQRLEAAPFPPARAAVSNTVQTIDVSRAANSQTRYIRSRAERADLFFRAHQPEDVIDGLQWAGLDPGTGNDTAASRPGLRSAEAKQRPVGSHSSILLPSTVSAYRGPRRPRTAADRPRLLACHRALAAWNEAGSLGGFPARS